MCQNEATREGQPTAKLACSVSESALPADHPRSFERRQPSQDGSALDEIDDSCERKKSRWNAVGQKEFVCLPQSMEMGGRRAFADQRMRFAQRPVSAEAAGKSLPALAKMRTPHGEIRVEPTPIAEPLPDC